MSTELIDVRMPDGTIVSGVPKGTSQSEVMRRYSMSQRPPAGIPHFTPPGLASGTAPELGPGSGSPATDRTSLLQNTLGVGPAMFGERIPGAIAAVTNYMFPAGDTPRPNAAGPPLTPQQEIGAKVATVAGLASTGESLAAAAKAKFGARVSEQLAKIPTPKEAIEGFLDKPREPVQALTQALKPTATNVNFAAHAERALPEIKAAESQLGRPIESVADLGDAIPIAKKNVWAEYEKVAGPQAARGVDASPVADAIERSIPLKLKIQDPKAVEGIKALADTYRRTFKLGELDDLLSTTNAELESYYAKYPAARRAAAVANPELAQNVAEGNALRDLIYKQLDNGGDSVREIKQTYGSLRNLEKETQRRLNVAARQNPDSLSEQVSRWQAAMKLGKAAVTFPVRPIGAIGDVAEAYVGRTVATALKKANSSDALVANALRNFEGQPIRSEPPLFQPAGLLERGAVPMPAAPDTSAVTAIPAQFARRDIKGLLPAAPKPAIITPPPPDTSAVTAIPGEFARQVRKFPPEVYSQEFGAALKQFGAEQTFNDVVSYRMKQLKDIAQSGATEVTGKGLRDMNEATGEVGPVLARGRSGFKQMFPELKTFAESPSLIAGAIEKGDGLLFKRIQKAVRDALPEHIAQPSDTDFAFGSNVSAIRAAAWRALHLLKERR